MNKANDIAKICYLCGDELGSEEVNEDHVFQKQFIKRKQAKAKGFYYAGTLTVHATCNNKFGGKGQGPEQICKKALHLIEVLHGERTLWKVNNPNPDIRIVAVNSSSLPEFTDEDVAYFKFNNPQDIPYEQWTKESYLKERPMVNPFLVPTNIALSTLAKSAAGFLVKTRGYPVQAGWRILAIPFFSDSAEVDLSYLFGEVKPLEVGVTLWIRREGVGWVLAYKHDHLIALFALESQESNLFRQLSLAFRNDGCLYYHSESLIGLVGYDWSKSKYPL